MPVLAQRVTFVGEYGFELHAPAEFGLTLWDALYAAGQPHGMLPAGYRALDCLRLEKGYRVWGTDLTPVTSPLCWAWVVPMTMIPQSLMATMSPGFGPDTSAGILPQPHLLAYYAIFFGFGALYYEADDRDGRLGRRWWLTLPIAFLVILPLGLVTAMRAWWLTGLFQVAYAWAMAFGLIGH